MASENENSNQSIRPKSEILGTGLSDPDCSAHFPYPQKTNARINAKANTRYVLISNGRRLLEGETGTGSGSADPGPKALPPRSTGNVRLCARDADQTDPFT